MYLRKLMMKDAPLMLEWMNDPSVVKDLHTDFLSKTIKDAESFIQTAEADNDTVHYAIASDEDEYGHCQPETYQRSKRGICDYRPFQRHETGICLVWYGIYN